MIGSYLQALKDAARQREQGDAAPEKAEPPLELEFETPAADLNADSAANATAEPMPPAATELEPQTSWPTLDWESGPATATTTSVQSVESPSNAESEHGLPVDTATEQPSSIDTPLSLVAEATTEDAEPNREPATARQTLLAEAVLSEAELPQQETMASDQLVAEVIVPPAVEVVTTAARAPDSPAQAAAVVNVPPAPETTSTSPPATSWWAGQTRSQSRGLLPWLALGGTVFLLGMAAWLGWEYQQLTRSSDAPARVIASAPASAVATADTGAEVAAVLAQSQPDASNTAIGYSSEPKENIDVAGNTQDKKEPAAAAPVAKLPATFAPPEVRFVRTVASAPSTVQAAYQAYQRGDLSLAERQYRAVLQREPRQRDALLGLAAIYLRRDDAPAALGVYQHLLALNPQDAPVQQAVRSLQAASGNEAMAAQNTQQGGEVSNPLAQAQFHAQRGEWAAAQALYFSAWQADPSQPDLAFNLAVSLDQLGQRKLAAEFYQQALQLAQQRPAQFASAAAEARLAQLRLAGY
ncbi:tetratricopeptide repeat protein [Chitinibacter tainanensis]|uniref:tetratricopeptide repeat protein n=1 Tax=Chitinibacter tainanensis TaxID=230667 RepID=UPI000404AD28|nr:tetratricopeptide repeat protein [Chitinibacter tainanensis]